MASVEKLSSSCQKLGKLILRTIFEKKENDQFYPPTIQLICSKIT